MGWLEGVLSGYADRHYQIEDDKRKEAQLSAEREGKVFETLLNSKYKDVQQYAMAGMLDLANPRRRKGGVAGWMGEVEQTPYLDMIKRTQARFDDDPAAAQANLREDDPWATTERGGTPPATPSIPTTGSVPGAPPDAPPAALPSTSQTTGGPATAPTPAPPPVPPPIHGSFAPGAPAAAGVSRPTASFRPGAAPSTSAAGVGLAPPAPPAGTAAPPAQAATGAPPAPPAPSGPPRVTRLQMPGIFPTTSDTVLDAARARAAGADLGEQDSYIRVALAQGGTRADGLKMWADDQAKGQGRQNQNMPMEFDVRHADGTSERVLGWADRRTQQYVDVNGRPFSPDVQVIKAAPYAATTGDVWWRMALNSLGIHPGQAANDPALAQRVQDEANRLSGGRAATVTTAQNIAGATKATAEGLHNDWMKVQGPIREMQRQFLLMQTGLSQFHAGEHVASVEAIRVTLEKILDPTSVVREGEYARQGYGLALMDRLDGLWQKWAAGGGDIPEPILAEMVGTAKQFLVGMNGWNDSERQRINNLAAVNKIDPSLIFSGSSSLPDAPGGVTPPPAGGSAPPPGVTPPPGATPPPGPKFEFDPVKGWVWK